jgi:hypothetical protein
MRAAAADDDGELAFVLNARGVRCECDGLVGADDGGRGLEKHERLFGDFVAELGSVRGVVAADADDFAGIDGGDEANGGERPGPRRLRPLGPRRAGDFADLIRVEDAIE